MLRSKHRLIDELVHIPGCEGLIRLVVCRQDRRELLTRHRIRSLLGSHECSDRHTVFDRVQMHR